MTDQEDIKKIFEIINGMMFQFGFHYGVTISQDLKDEIKRLKKRLIK